MEDSWWLFYEPRNTDRHGQWAQDTIFIFDIEREAPFDVGNWKVAHIVIGILIVILVVIVIVK